MKTVLFFLLLACFGLPAQAQNYDTGVVFSSIFVKIKGTIEISDSTAIFSFKESTSRYSVVKKVNNLVYVTDGVMTHTLTFVSKTGKMRGFAYDTMITFVQDKRQGNATVMYYAKEKK
jgi:hypothetical protein